MRALPFLIVALLAFPSLSVAAPISTKVFDITVLGPGIALRGASEYYQGQLEATFTAQSVGPTTAPVPLSGRNVELRQDDGTLVGTAITDPTGKYGASAIFPARGITHVRAIVDAGQPTQGVSAAQRVQVADGPSAPRNVIVTAGPGWRQIQFTWDPPTDDGGAPVQTYRIYGWEVGAGNQSYTANGTNAGGRGANDTHVYPDSAYNYSVVAGNAAAEGTPVNFTNFASLATPIADALWGNITGFTICDSTCHNVGPNVTFNSDQSAVSVAIRTQARSFNMGAPIPYKKHKMQMDADFPVAGASHDNATGRADAIGWYTPNFDQWDYTLAGPFPVCRTPQFSVNATLVTPSALYANDTASLTICH